MRNPKISTKRVLGLALAAALAVGATVAVSSSSEAVTTPAASITPVSGSNAASTVITVKGKGFTDSTGAAAVLAVKFTTAACTSTVATGTAAASFNVVSATKAVVTSPTTLATGSYYLCLLDASSGTTANILGQAKFATGAPPTVSSLGSATGSSLGGTAVVVNGTGFSKASKVYFDGVAATTTFVSSTKLSAIAPSHAAGTAITVKATSEFGSATSTSFAYVAAVSVSPAAGGTSANAVVTLTGVGFNAYAFSNTAVAAKTIIAAVPAPATLSVGAASPANLCTTIAVESDTSLSCKLPALDGAYTIELVTLDSASTPTVASTSAVSKSATYTASAF